MIAPSHFLSESWSNKIRRPTRIAFALLCIALHCISASENFQFDMDSGNDGKVCR